ncbi:MAG: hypothetical protein IPK39_10715, partial [Sulfuritalea sp.]|nr:hypothetical protein [Sulfuritalea sp.]
MKATPFLAAAVLDRIRVVLSQPSHPAISSVRRAMKTMVQRAFVLVNPLTFPDAHADAMRGWRHR